RAPGAGHPEAQDRRPAGAPGPDLRPRRRGHPRASRRVPGADRGRLRQPGARPGLPARRALVRRGPGLDERHLLEPAAGGRSHGDQAARQAADRQHRAGDAVTGLSDRTALRWGGATDVGRVRTSNQDNYLARQDKGIWAVADGMGGHNGGEIASQIACQMLGEAFAEPTVEGLVDAIEAANAAVHRAGADDPQLTGMGTTVVALAVVEHEGDEVLAIANVGDSRCYRYAAGELDQVTTDHSLVADLVREGSLSPEEAAVHPRRQIVTRVLGVDAAVPVDVFAVDPHAGDRFVLCSDGLFNEVPEPAIAAVLATTEDPEDAAHELVRLAVDGGGRDNVTVVVVDVVGDGGRAAEASTALAREGGPTAEGRPEPRPSPAYATEADPRGRLARRRTDTAELERVVTDDGDDLDD